MIRHDPKEWIWHILTLRKADTVRRLGGSLVIMGVYSAGIAFLMLDYWHLPSDSLWKNTSLIHTLLGFVISMLLVFRTNTAYDRWWEGRRLWGSLVNNSRNLALKLNPLLGETEHKERDFFYAMIPNFAFALKNHLRGHFVETEFIESPLFKLSDLRRHEHIPAQIAAAIVSKVTELQRRGVLQPEHLLFLNVELLSLMDVCGACERIHKTPIPFSYSSFIKKFIFFYCITLPIGYAFSLGYHVVLLAVFVFYVLASLEVIAEEIEDPFGTDANDLPADTICKAIEKTVQELLPMSSSHEVSKASAPL